MGCFIRGLEDAKMEIIEKLKNNESTYKPILEIIDGKAKGKFDSPLKLAGYFLNPYYYYMDDNVQRHPNIMVSLLHVLRILS